MAFRSYAQNFEDIMLYKALQHIEKGFYVDVGAQDPVTDSVTKAFYDLGWRGVNIEPIHSWYQRLEADRPEDLNICLAVSDRVGAAEIYELQGSGLSTMYLDYAIGAESRGYTKKVRIVQTRPLSDILQEDNICDAHFLKVDVEGHEEQVIRGTNFQNFRPWIILVESIRPNSNAENYFPWERLLLSANYAFVYFDGINRYYVSAERAHLKEAFSTPPNLFDLGRPARDWFFRPEDEEQKEKIEQLSSRLQNLENELETTRRDFQFTLDAARRKEADARHQTLASRDKLRKLKSSSTWRATRPLRGVREHILRASRLTKWNSWMP